MRFVLLRSAFDRRPMTGLLRMRSAPIPWCVAMLVAIAVAACTDTHKLVRPTEVGMSLSAGGSGYVALPTDGRYGDTLYVASGLQTAQAVATAFAPYLKTVSVAATIEDLETAKRSAQVGGHDYLLLPQNSALGRSCNGVVGEVRPDFCEVVRDSSREWRGSRQRRR